MQKRPKLAHWLLLTLIYGVAGATLATHVLGHDTTSAAQPQFCQTSLRHITVSLKDSVFEPDSIYASRCDTLQFVNRSSVTHEIALGQHIRHTQYPGFSERLLAPDQTVDMQLNTAGQFELHDHLHENMKASLIIRE